MRYVLLILFVIISLHYILSFSHEGYGRATSISHIKDTLKGGQSSSPTFSYANSTARANAAFVILARNGDINGISSSVKQMEDRFNKKFRYPYVFLNEEPFSDEFKSRITELTDATVEFGLIPHDDWFQPSSIDEKKATASREQMIKDQVIYGGSVPYRNMCRFNSGFFWRHPLLDKYKYYWRVEYVLRVVRLHAVVLTPD
ncbi:hypothetical protein HGRIS_013044 [Hohenbuehelia grisea]|uniref:Uncharacterized protein n=1 Tax=Hohenbuehelia grisea TaxID=104357 RepID=A0ABR3IUC4_9AGAR